MTVPPSSPGSGQDLPSDVTLLQVLARGDETALLQLHRRYAGRFLALARHHGFPDPEQAVEDAFVLLYRSAGCFARSELEAPTWIIGLAHWHFRTATSSARSHPTLNPQGAPP